MNAPTYYTDFSQIPEGSKVSSYDEDGYYRMNVCGIVAKHLPDGHAIIKSFSDNLHYSSVGEHIDRIEILHPL